MTPTDEKLRRFLLGTLPREEAEPIAAWAEASPGADDALRRLDRPDALAGALRRPGGTPAPPDEALDLLRDMLAPAGAAPEGDYRTIRELEPVQVLFREVEGLI